jgi:hypothetical protein
MRIEHVKLSTEGSNSWYSTVLFSGLANTGGARGARAISMASCLVFGADGYSIVLEGVAGFSFVGGGTYAAGGTNPLSGAIRVAGSSDFKATGVLLIGDHFGMLHLRHVLGMKVIVASGIAGSLIDGEHFAINADETVDRVLILGEPFGVTRTSWVNSSIVMPDGSIRR